MYKIMRSYHKTTLALQTNILSERESSKEFKKNENEITPSVLLFEIQGVIRTFEMIQVNLPTLISIC